MADEDTDGPVYVVKRRADVRMMFKQTATPLPDGLRQEARQIAARMFGLGPETSGPARPGEHLGPYRVTRVLGVGGQAYVYEAEHSQLGRTVALKVPRKDVAERLLREARMSAKLDHPRMVRVEDVGEHEGPAGTVPYLVMEYLEGGSLDHILEQHPEGLPLTEVRRIGGAVLEALDYAHRQGVVHRDVKPSNVLFDAKGEPKLSDLGIGIMSSGDLDHSVELSRLTQDGAAVGTPLFMAPEQEDPSRLGAESVDGRADLFSFGKMLFVMLTGASPRTIRPVSRMRDGLDPAWDDVIFKLVEEDRELRYPDAAAVLAAIDELPGARLRVKVTPSDSSDEHPAITVKEKGTVPVGHLVFPEKAPTGFLLPPGTQRAAWFYNLCAFFSAAFAGYLAWLSTHQSAWVRKEFFPLIAGAALASFFLWRFRRGEERAERSLGPFMAGFVTLLIGGWQPLMFAGRYGFWIDPIPGLFHMRHGEFIGMGYALDLALVAMGCIILLLYRWRRRPRPPRAGPGGGDGDGPIVRAKPRGPGGVVLRVFGVITGVVTLASSAVLAVVALVVAGAIALFSAVTERGVDATIDLGPLGDWDAGAATGVILIAATLVGILMVVLPLNGLLRGPRPSEHPSD